MIPVNADAADVAIILVPEQDSFVNPMGVKGIGEFANIFTAAAVANAVSHATSVRVRKLPMRGEAFRGVAVNETCAPLDAAYKKSPALGRASIDFTGLSRGDYRRLITLTTRTSSTCRLMSN
jgi:hypothetical protein